MKWLLIIVLLFLVGCGTKSYNVSEKQADTSLEEFLQDIIDCEEGATTYVEFATCENKERTQHFNQIEYKYMDLVELLNAYFLAVASRLDSGTMTIEEANLIMTQVKQELSSTAAQRLSSQPNGWKILSQILAGTTESYFQNRAHNRPITCMQNGPFFNCN